MNELKLQQLLGEFKVLRPKIELKNREDLKNFKRPQPLSESNILEEQFIGTNAFIKTANTDILISGLLVDDKKAKEIFSAAEMILKRCRDRSIQCWEHFLVFLYLKYTSSKYSGCV